MAKIVLTDAKMKMLQSVWSDINALGEVKIAPDDNENTLIKEVLNADLLVTCYASITRNVINAGKNLKAILKWVNLDRYLGVGSHCGKEDRYKQNIVRNKLPVPGLVSISIFPL